MKCVKILLLSLCCLMLCSGCGKKEQEKESKAKVQEDASKKEPEDKAGDEAKPDSRTDNEIIADAMEKTAKLPSFQVSSEGSLKLGGKTISGEFGMSSEIHVVQGDDGQDLKMTMETRINPGNTVSKAYYKDGWYYADDGKNRIKEEKSPKEVLGIVTVITDMIRDASDQIENIRIEEDGADKIYSYELPAYLAEDYIVRLIGEMGTQDKILENASAQVENVTFVSRINAEGVLVRQEISADGTLKKAIVSVPAKAGITAEFTETDETELQIE